MGNEQQTQEQTQEIKLSDLNDSQKSVLTELAFLDITPEGIAKASSPEGLKVSELKQYLALPDQIFITDLGPLKDIANPIAEKLLGANCPLPTDERVVDELIEYGLGDLTITHIADKQGILSNGFQAFTLKDSTGDVGIAYRGLDGNINQGWATDFIKSCLGEYMADNSIQAETSIDYFDEHKATGENQTYIYGASNGGNLVSHVYLARHSLIEQAFAFNPNPISSDKIQTQEQIEAFNDPKFECFIVCGDFISGLKGHEKYENNVKYVPNNSQLAFQINDPITAHMWQSGLTDKDGNFVLTDRPEAIKEMVGYLSKQFVDDPVQTCKNLFEVAKGLTQNPQETLKGTMAIGVEGITTLSQHVKGWLDDVLEQNPSLKAQANAFAKDDWRSTIAALAEDGVTLFNAYVRGMASKYGIESMKNFDITQSIPDCVLDIGSVCYNQTIEFLDPTTDQNIQIQDIFENVSAQVLEEASGVYQDTVGPVVDGIVESATDFIDRE